MNPRDFVFLQLFDERHQRLQREAELMRERRALRVSFRRRLAFALAALAERLEPELREEPAPRREREPWLPL